MTCSRSHSQYLTEYVPNLDLFAPDSHGWCCGFCHYCASPSHPTWDVWIAKVRLSLRKDSEYWQNGCRSPLHWRKVTLSGRWFSHRPLHPVWNRRCQNHPTLRRLFSWPYLVETSLLYLSNWSQGWAVLSQGKTFADCIPFYFLSWDSQESKATFFFQPRGVGERHLNNGLSPWPPDWAQSYLVMYGAGNNYLLVHLFSGLWVTGD